MYTQVFDPVSDSLGLSSIFAALPLVVLFVLLGVVRMAAQWAALIALAVALLVAIAIYDMPVGQSLDSGVEGAAFGLFPIMWIVVNAIWIYNMTVESGHFNVLRRSGHHRRGPRRAVSSPEVVGSAGQAPLGAGGGAGAASEAAQAAVELHVREDRLDHALALGVELAAAL
jgi:hypothetical protein